MIKTKHNPDVHAECFTSVPCSNCIYQTDSGKCEVAILNHKYDKDDTNEL